MTNEQSKALRLVDALTNPRRWHDLTDDDCEQAAAELRRLHAENSDFRATTDHLTRENAEQIGEIVALKEQRDELLEALEHIEGLAMADDWRDLPEIVRIARAAITKGEKS